MKSMRLKVLAMIGSGVFVVTGASCTPLNFVSQLVGNLGNLLIG